MTVLLLFDVDRTLVTTAPDGRFEKTIANAHGIESKLDGDFQGYTDYLLLALLLHDAGWSEQQVAQAMPGLLQELEAVHVSTFTTGSVTVLPGVVELLEALESAGCALGLITGNVKTIAQRKLAAGDLWGYFGVGGFGDDPHVARSDLVTVAVQRAGFEGDLDRVFVIGDTARDIAAAHGAGVRNSVGVLNGFRDARELIDAGASIVLDDFTDTALVLDRLGIR